MSRLRGRPKKSVIDLLRVKVWFNSVQIASGGFTAYALEHQFNPTSIHKSHGEFSRSGIWEKYKRGDSVPRQSILERVESIYPGTARMLDHPLWTVLKQPLKEQEAINQVLVTLDERVVSLLFERTNKSSNIFSKRLPFTESTVDSLIHLGDLDAFTALILSVQESESIGSDKLRQMALSGYFGISEYIAANPLFFEIHPTLFQHIDTLFPHYVFLSANNRMRIVMFWQGYRDKYWPEILKVKSQQLSSNQPTVIKSQWTNL